MSTSSRILHWFESVGEGTVEECRVALGLQHDSVSPRVSELVRAGRLVVTTGRKHTREGHTGAIYAVQTEDPSTASGKTKSRARTLTPQEQAILAAAKKYIAARPQAKSKEQAKAIIVKLLRSLDTLAVTPSKENP